MYDGTTSVTADISGITFSGLLAGDSLGTSSASFSDANAGSNKAISVSFTGSDGANYVVPSVSGLTATIASKALTATGAVSDKIYDGTTSADVALALGGLVSGETLGSTVTAAFDSKNVGTRTATISSFGLSDDTGLSANYSLSNSDLTFTANTATIASKALTATGAVSDKIYDGTTSADVALALGGLVSGETLGSTVTAAFDSKNVGTRTATISSFGLSDDTGLSANYSLSNSDLTFTANTATIASKALTATGTVSGRAYEAGNTDANVSLVLSGLVAGETLRTRVAAAFDSAEAGLRTAQISSVSLLDGTGTAGNYSLALNNVLIANNIARITAAAAGYQLGKENSTGELKYARPLRVSANFEADERGIELPAVRRTLPPANEELPNPQNTQATTDEETREAQAQAAFEIDVVQEAGTAAPSVTEDQLIAQTQQPQSPENIVFTLRDARTVSLESLMLSSNEPLIISVNETSTISAIKQVEPIEIEEEEEIELQLSEVFPEIDVTDDVSVAISFTNGNTPQWVGVNRASQSIKIRPPSGVQGLQTLRLGVADEAGNMAATSLRVVVSSRNIPAETSTVNQANIDQPAINLSLTSVQDLPGFLSVQALRPTRFDAGSRFVFEIPNGTFVHENSGDPLRYAATLADGSPLPSWMTFDPETQTFSGEAPEGAATQLDVIVKAIDSASQEAQVQLRIEVD